MANLVINNRMSASEFVRRNGGKLDFVKNPNTGKVFFACGSKRGYISKKILAAPDVKLEDMQYGEIQASINGQPTVVPTLFLASTTNVVKSFTL